MAKKKKQVKKTQPKKRVRKKKNVLGMKDPRRTKPAKRKKIEGDPEEVDFEKETFDESELANANDDFDDGQLDLF